MSETATVFEILKVAGSGTIIFMIWYIYHKAVSTQFNTIINNQSEREKASFDQLNKIIELQAKREETNFKLLQDMVSTNLLQSAQLERIEAEILTNQWCPVYRKLMKKGNVTNGKSNVTAD